MTRLNLSRQLLIRNGNAWSFVNFRRLNDHTMQEISLFHDFMRHRRAPSFRPTPFRPTGFGPILFFVQSYFRPFGFRPWPIFVQTVLVQTVRLGGTKIGQKQNGRL